MIKVKRTKPKRQISPGNSLRWHEHASTFPMLDGQPYCDLGEDIRADWLAVAAASEVRVHLIDTLRVDVRITIHEPPRAKNNMSATAKSNGDLTNMEDCKRHLPMACDERHRVGGAVDVG